MQPELIPDPQAQRVLDTLARSPERGISSRIQLRLARQARARILRRGDPPVAYELHGRRLILPLSHQLPAIRGRHPEYSENVGRIAREVLAARPGAPLIDVGANVGDTVAIVRDAIDCRVLCIEGSPFFLGFLRANLAALGPGVEIEPSFVATTSGSVSASLKVSGGTATMVAGDAGAESIPVRSLEDILADHAAFGDFGMLKIDTDGFDCRIIRGAIGALRRTRAAVFFEYMPDTLTELGDDGVSVFSALAEAGYRRALVYDNLGRFMVELDASEHERWLDLHSYFSGRGVEAYMDVLVLHGQDDAVAERLRTIELGLANRARH